jgi:hypothetical protein
LNKIAAEEVRSAAAEKARLAEQERARLAAEGAKQAELAKAAAAAKAAEDARIAAEKAKLAEDAKAAEAEKIRLAEQEKAQVAAAKPSAMPEPARADTAPTDSKQQVAALPPPATNSDQQTGDDLPRALQSELRRLGCNTGAADGTWNAAAQKALDLFNKHSGLKLDVKAGADALEVLKSKTTRVCPLVCDHGFKADGDNCIKIACRAGYRINDDNECEKVPEKKPVAAREEAKPKPKRDTERKDTEARPTKPQVSGQIFCNQYGCHPVGAGCRLVHTGRPGEPNNGSEVCN